MCRWWWLVVKEGVGLLALLLQSSPPYIPVSASNFSYTGSIWKFLSDSALFLQLSIPFFDHSIGFQNVPRAILHLIYPSIIFQAVLEISIVPWHSPKYSFSVSTAFHKFPQPIIKFQNKPYFHNSLFNPYPCNLLVFHYQNIHFSICMRVIHNLWLWVLCIFLLARSISNLPIVCPLPLYYNAFLIH